MLNRTTSPHQKAFRLLFLLLAGGVPPDGADAAEAEAVFVGEKRMQAFDFWIRYPDYLADELLNLFGQSRDAALLDQAAAIVQDREPDLRRYPMVRFRYGAYERMDDAVAILEYRGLVKVRMRDMGHYGETDFLIRPGTRELADRAIAEHPVLRWYADRAALVNRVAGGQSGDALKERQYRRIEYARTPLNRTIPGIADTVVARLRDLLDGHNGGSR
ncbi:hypothetical protein JHL17_13370 [Azospirillum sp. YIM B02556]|uniref:DUF4136 domain-containing protein n=1 Tax=Azospirillum endophyticum TaxID=2800326 RepID=A0ABS1F4Q6_9PROT|nr:hypothetical protein [Azospirillum endophyticum]MBK1838404.1 hypothetical protein [Azospirillum endophyticum]